MKPKIIRACTVPQSLSFVEGMLDDIQQNYDVVLMSSPGPEWDRLKLEHPDVCCIEVPMERHISPLKDLKSLSRIIRVFRRERPAMVHSMTPKAGLLCMMAAWLCRVPVRVHTFTGLVFPTATGLKRKLLMLTDRITCACATHVIPEGEGVKRDLLDYGITKKNIKVLGYGNCKGIDLDRFSDSDDVKKQAADLSDSEAFTFIAVGRLVGDKGINELVDAFVKLNCDNPATRLLLVGDYEPELDPLSAETIEAIETCPSIWSVGYQADVRPWYSASDCAVLASYREGFPNVVIEAGAMGLPQIVTDINGANEIIGEGMNGTIVPSKSAEALYRVMKRMIEDSEWRNHLISNARKMIETRYDQRYVRKCLYEFYDGIIKR